MLRSRFAASLATRAVVAGSRRRWHAARYSAAATPIPCPNDCARPGWIRLPAGSAINARHGNTWVFPPGARRTGLAKWTLRNFIDTIRNGRHMGRGREILPPMPIAMYKHMNDADLGAICAYLQSIPATVNRVPDPLPPSAPVAAGKS